MKIPIVCLIGITAMITKLYAVEPVKAPVAQTFSLHDVRLLDGPFKEGQDIAAKYLLSLEPDRLLSWFRKEAGLKLKAEGYPGWDANGLGGHSLGHYLTACSLAWASTGEQKFLDRANYIVSELAACQQAHGDGYVSGIRDGRKRFAEIEAGNVRARNFGLNDLWVPHYTQHKVFAGLRDAYRLCGNQQALSVSKGLADWYEKTHAGLSEEQMQQVLQCEHGGMNEVFADLYADTGNVRYLKLAQCWHHKAILDPLAASKDILPGKHANTQVPKLVGLATLYELAGDPTDKAAVDFFWDRVVHHHSYVTGGHCDGEHFGEPGKLNDRLSEHTTETCNINNMLKLSEHVFGWRPEAEVADFYERALLNQIRSTQHPDGRVVYNQSLKPGYPKHYQGKYAGFSCCVGTGMENHVKYAQGIYFHSDSDLWVNLFIPSVLEWKSRGLTVRQDSSWPFGETSKLTIKTDKKQTFSLNIRHPYWAEKLEVKVNGQAVSHITTPSSYCRLTREWSDGDRVELCFPMHLRTESMPDNPNRIAVLYGPTVLAADLGEINTPAACEADFVPVLVVGDRPVSEWLKPVDLTRQHFRTEGGARPQDANFVPLHNLHDRHYSVYMDKFTAAEWSYRKAEISAEKARIKAFEARTMDFFQPGEMQPERDHHLKEHGSFPGEFRGRKYRHARDDGWFSFEMKVDPVKPNELCCTYWGSETGKRTFDILVEGEKIATQTLSNNKPDQFWGQSYFIPFRLTQGKEKVTVRLKPQPGNIAGGLFGARMLLQELK